MSRGPSPPPPPVGAKRARFALACLVVTGVLVTCCVRERPSSMAVGGGTDGAAPDGATSDGAGRDGTGGEAGTSPGGRPALRPAGLGTNVCGVADWTPQDPFLDVYKRSRRLLSGSDEAWADDRELALDAHHQLLRLEEGQIARTTMLTDHGRYPGGRYVLTHEGEAELRFTRPIISREPGRIVLDVPAPTNPDDTALFIDVLSVNPEDPLRNVHVYPPLGFCAADRSQRCERDADCAGGACTSFEEASLAGELFRPSFVASLAPYRMLRFMDWGQTNASTVVEWEDRAQLADATYAHAGVPLERMIELANLTGAQPWFCIPHLASDDYVRRFAELVLRDLDPSLPVWVEYSNEIWNSMFRQAREVEARGEALGLGEGMDARLRYQGVRSTEIFDLVDAVLGPERVVRVLATQSDWSDLAEKVIAGAEGRADVLAIAPYVGLLPGPEEARRVVSGGYAALQERSLGEVLPEVLQAVREHAAIARRHGLDLVAYEGGQHFVGIDQAVNDDALNALFDRFNRDPAMGRLYTQMLEGWAQAGGGWFNHFVDVSRPGNFGRWGAREYAGQPRSEAPKLDALLRFGEAHPEGW